MLNIKCPDPFLELRVEKVDLVPSLFAWCAGYESGEWRSKQLAKHLIEWIPEFALTYSEWTNIHSGNAVRQAAKAAQLVYQSMNYERRGEFGEILLHALVRQKFGSLPLICKYYYKDAVNDTVKGFDAVHIVPTADPIEFELWLGESKLYDDPAQAITEAARSLNEHFNDDYLKTEFLLISNKIEPSFPNADKIKALIHRNRSLDQIISKICVPVLIAYSSEAIERNTCVSDQYNEHFEKEVLILRDLFAQKKMPTKVVIRLFLVPLKSKGTFLDHLDEALKACQKL